MSEQSNTCNAVQTTSQDSTDVWRDTLHPHSLLDLGLHVTVQQCPSASLRVHDSLVLVANKVMQPFCCVRAVDLLTGQ